MRSAGQVVVVDDDVAILTFVKDALQDEGYSVIAVDNAGAALDALMSLWDRQPVAILLDVNLPQVDGKGFAELYRLLPVRQAPIILMSASDTLGAVASQIEAQDMLRKPFHLDDLLTRLHRAVLAGDPIQQRLPTP